ncbi:carbohydrate ABC transporter substrate-binding protein, CUT1 family [Haladaptatus litoreus]|uniref:Carbohydrate ABC transporter substrate-binding protein, CUT1 family n=2 Tax=Haladaptatus litoreus TaxID=553468 RepID=A0A1N7CGL0_9EURY|nr:carbohydrate ABC transporter substrate-binding protein, CUT1 family [Haladaptatus litoreus]
MYTRRKCLRSAAASVVGIASLAGCSSNRSEVEKTTTKQKTQDESMSLEIQHSWTQATEKDAITSLFEGFQDSHTEIEINEQTVAGRGGGNLQTTVKKRIIDNDPPDSWQSWSGQNLRTYVDAGVLQRLQNGMLQKMGWNAFSPISKQLTKIDGSFVAVPLNIHRLNNLFYNVEIMDEVGIDPHTIQTPRMLIDTVKLVEETTDSSGVVHATKNVWPTLELWESVLLGEHGFETHQAIVNGEMRSNERAVRESLGLVDEYHEQSPDGIVSSNWREAARQFQSGNVAFFHQGDWAPAAFRNDDFEFEIDWNCTAFPGTNDQYLLSMDSFPFSKHSSAKTALFKFLQYVSSVEAQQRFTQKRGSIPPRKDVPASEYDPFYRRQINRFRKTNTQLPSIAHGLAIPPASRADLTSAMQDFTSTWDVEQTTREILTMFD